MIKLLQGDCLEKMKDVPDGSVDMVLTDPPYGTTACKWDSVIPFDEMWEQLNRIIKPNGAIVLFGSEPFSSALRMSNIKNYKYDWVWEKERPSNPMLAKKQPLSYNENISVFYKKQCLYNPQKTKGKANHGRLKGEHFNKITQSKSIYSSNTDDMKYPKRIVKFNTERDKDNGHPTQKPVALMEYLIKTYTNEGETVLDFAMGSGTTGVACANLGRDFIGVEMDLDYFNIALTRIEEAITANDLREGSNGGN